jgi:cyclic beta-1,2-glucan synthetase
MTEPYVIAADVYGVDPHVGRGGWTWYTGSAGWMQRVLTESILGLTLHDGRTLRLAPCVPDAWPGFRATLRFGAVTVEVHAERTGAGSAVASARSADAEVQIDDGFATVALPDAGCVTIYVTLGT